MILKNENKFGGGGREEAAVEGVAVAVAMAVVVVVSRSGGRQALRSQTCINSSVSRNSISHTICACTEYRYKVC